MIYHGLARHFEHLTVNLAATSWTWFRPDASSIGAQGIFRKNKSVTQAFSGILRHEACSYFTVIQLGDVTPPAI